MFSFFLSDGRDNILGGTPTYSPDLSPLDNGTFGTFQNCYSLKFKKEKNLHKNRLKAPNLILKEIIIRIFKSQKFKKISAKSITHQEKVLREVLRRNGDFIASL